MTAAFNSRILIHVQCYQIRIHVIHAYYVHDPYMSMIYSTVRIDTHLFGYMIETAANALQ